MLCTMENLPGTTRLLAARATAEDRPRRRPLRCRTRGRASPWRSHFPLAGSCRAAVLPAPGRQALPGVSGISGLPGFGHLTPQIHHVLHP
jgi:hypothetical protein